MLWSTTIWAIWIYEIETGIQICETGDSNLLPGLNKDKTQQQEWNIKKQTYNYTKKQNPKNPTANAHFDSTDKDKKIP